MSKRDGIWAGLVLTAVMVLGTGCGTAPVRTYEPLRIGSVASQGERWQALRELVKSEGWTVAQEDAARGQLVATRPTEIDANIREVMSVNLTAKDSVISMKTEMFDGQSWVGSESVCGQYTHARENALAERLESRHVEQVIAQRGGTPRVMTVAAR